MNSKVVLFFLILNIFLSACGQSGDLILPSQGKYHQPNQKIVEHVS